METGSPEKRCRMLTRLQNYDLPIFIAAVAFLPQSLDFDVLKRRVLGLQPGPPALLEIALDREFPGEQCQHDRAVHGRSRAIDDGDIAREQPCLRHALAGDPHGESRSRPAAR